MMADGGAGTGGVQELLEWEVRGRDDMGHDLNRGRQRHDLAPRAGQVLYAAFLLHCGACTLPLGTCRFPGCGAIRGECIGAMDKQVASDNFARSMASSSGQACRLHLKSAAACMRQYTGITHGTLNARNHGAPFFKIMHDARPPRGVQQQ